MEELYLKAKSKQQVIDLLAANDMEMQGDYFQNDKIVVDWVGKIPKEIDSETGEVISWYSDYRFNVLLIDESVTVFNELVSVHPDTPYRMFS